MYSVFIDFCIMNIRKLELIFSNTQSCMSDFIMQIFISLSWTDTKYLYFKNFNIRRVFVRMHSDNSVCFVNVIFTHDRD
jgi:hypothetical protein